MILFVSRILARRYVTTTFPPNDPDIIFRKKIKIPLKKHSKHHFNSFQNTKYGSPIQTTKIHYFLKFTTPLFHILCSKLSARKREGSAFYPLHAHILNPTGKQKNHGDGARTNLEEKRTFSSHSHFSNFDVNGIFHFRMLGEHFQRFY